MIHQFIFAAPRPGWPAERFQNYWLQEHAIQYASKIRQIRQYLIVPRVRVHGTPNEVAAFEGVAEIWLNNDSDQLQSLLSPEFLNGARPDEPNWAAFWLTFVHDSISEVTLGTNLASSSFFKLYLFLRRQGGSDLETFRKELRGPITERAHALPGLARRVLAPCRDNAYDFGEPRFDALDLLAFPSQREYQAAIASPQWIKMLEALSTLAEQRYFFAFTGSDRWIIRPGERT
jgi:hypothetical protein